MTPSYMGKARNALLAGDVERTEAILAGMPDSSDPEFIQDYAMIHFHARQFEQALETCKRLPEFREAQFNVVSGPWSRGIVYSAMDQSERARPELEAARALFKAHLETDPDDANTCSALAIVEAYLGSKAEARREAARALELFPANRDQWIRQYRVFDQVRVQILTGDTEAALDQLEKLLATPTDRVSRPLLRLSPMFDPLRSSPRFQRLLQPTS
jgi:Flp pilus assembly protein TadD